MVLGSRLVGAGFGAWLAGRIAESQRRPVGLLVPLVVGAIVFVLMWLAEKTISQSFAVRVTISVTALTLAGAMMGMPFPLGMARFDDCDRSWYRAINGATNVLASVLALVIALLAGFAVWKGGSVMAVALTLLELGEVRDLYLFDTFEGMTPPTDRDITYAGVTAAELLASPTGRMRCDAAMEEVRQAVRVHGLPDGSCASHRRPGRGNPAG